MSGKTAGEGPTTAQPVQPRTPRAATRHKLFRPIGLDTADGHSRAHLLNLSLIGACVHARCSHRVWSGVTLHLGDRKIDGRVTWTQGERCGVKFVRPLTDAELVALTR